MLALLFAATLLQTPKTPDRIRDAEFARVQEEWVRDAAKPKSFNQVLPPAHVKLLAVLSCDHGDCRAMAEEKIRGMGFDAVRLLYWGTTAKDRNTAFRCGLMMANLFACDQCGGTGLCRYVNRARSAEYGWPSHQGEDTPYGPCPDGCDSDACCVKCEGGGDLRRKWRHGDWSGEGAGMVAKDLFGAALIQAKAGPRK